MYCVRVEPGKERIRVRHFPSAFVPSYVSAAMSTNGRHLLVVPGYIFMMTRIGGSEAVSANEWKMIEAISDRKPSVLDAETGQIVDGPLKELPVSRVDQRAGAVLIRAKLFGITRDYWLPVQIAKPDDNSGELPAVSENEKPEDPSEKVTKEKAVMNKSDKPVFTAEQRAEILARALRDGVRQTAEAYGITWQMVAQMKRRAAEAAGEPASEKKAPVRRKTKMILSEGKEETESPVAEAEKSAADETSATSDSLAVENALLKEKIVRLEGQITKLESQIAKLKKAMAELL